MCLPFCSVITHPDNAIGIKSPPFCYLFATFQQLVKFIIQFRMPPLPQHRQDCSKLFFVIDPADNHPLSLRLPQTMLNAFHLHTEFSTDSDAPVSSVIEEAIRLGGEIITVGSDAHQPEHIGYDFQKVSGILKSCGFDYYTIFKDRKPEFLPLK